jgi:sarcosine oxidase subunit alpha
MSASVRVIVNGQPVDMPAGASVAAAVGACGMHFRRAVDGEPRAPLCGMGVCFECRVRIDGISQLRACMTPAIDGMRVDTDA